MSVSIGGAQNMTLSGAVLVYQGGRGAFAVWHPAKPGPNEGAPYLGEAEPLTTEFLRALSTGLGVYAAPEKLASSVLVRTFRTLGLVDAGAAPYPLLWRAKRSRK
jgi:hypothetical protein